MQPRASDRQPNVVVVICDDVGYGDLGCYGGTVVRTPRLDELARSGARFTDMYSGGPTCTPARAALLTGRVAPRTGADRVLFPGDVGGLHHGETTAASYLTRAGYATGAFGKWHVGAMPGHGPRAFGFGTYFGMPFSNDMEPRSLYQDDTVVEIDPDVSSLTRRYSEAAIRFVKETPVAQPLFAYVAFTMPHYPVAPAEPFAGRSAGGPYGDVCEEIDHYAGELYDVVRNRDDSRDTLFVFTSDHGPWFEGSTGGLRGRKFETWDGGVRVPFLLSWESVVRPETVVDTAAATVDVLPMLRAAAGLTEPPDNELDGQDLTELLRGKGDSERPIWLFDGEQLNAVRAGRWKLHRRRQTWGGDRHAQWSLPQLFDMRRDPSECYDLASRHPDVVARLTAAMTAFEASL